MKGVMGTSLSLPSLRKVHLSSISNPVESPPTKAWNDAKRQFNCQNENQSPGLNKWLEKRVEKGTDDSLIDWRKAAIKHKKGEMKTQKSKQEASNSKKTTKEFQYLPTNQPTNQ